VVYRPYPSHLSPPFLLSVSFPSPSFLSSPGLYSIPLCNLLSRLRENNEHGHGQATDLNTFPLPTYFLLHFTFLLPFFILHFYPPGATLFLTACRPYFYMNQRGLEEDSPYLFSTTFFCFVVVVVVTVLQVCREHWGSCLCFELQ
jgi:hypothetical protein